MSSEDERSATPDASFQEEEEHYSEGGGSRRMPRRKRKFFGVLGSTPKYFVPETSEEVNYEEKYPEDEQFKEMGTHARIWRVFIDEYTKYDSEMISRWRDSLDVTLLFSSIFSVVIATFAIQSSRDLRIDYRAVMALMIPELIELQRAYAEGLPIDDIPHFAFKTYIKQGFRPRTGALWINGLWFTSLALSLFTTLICILAKQWINVYSTLPSGSPRDLARIRQMRFIGLENWHVPLIIHMLPLVLHFSVGMFFAGLMIFCASFSRIMACMLGGIATTALLVYLLCTAHDVGMKRTGVRLHNHTQNVNENRTDEANY